MLATGDFPALSEALAVFGPGGTVIGGSIGLCIKARDLRGACENLALGAAAGGVLGCAAAFLVYAAMHAVGWVA